MARNSLKILDSRSSGSQYHLKRASTYKLKTGQNQPSLYLSKFIPKHFIQTQQTLENTERLSPRYNIQDGLVSFYADNISNSEKRFSKTQETADMVRKVIADYYSARLDKTKNHWLYKLTRGTTKHLKGIFIGRCWDYQLKANDLKRPTLELHCERLWNKFVNAFSYKGPCDVTINDYRPFFEMYTEKSINNKVRLHSSQSVGLVGVSAGLCCLL